MDKTLDLIASMPWSNNLRDVFYQRHEAVTQLLRAAEMARVKTLYDGMSRVEFYETVRSMPQPDPGELIKAAEWFENLQEFVNEVKGIGNIKIPKRISRYASFAAYLCRLVADNETTT